jgi:hypothetical protein
MQTWANIDSNNYVIRVVQIDNSQDLPIFQGADTAWVDVSDSKNGPNFLELGRIYLPEKNAVVTSKLYPSWILNQETMIWKAPVDKPSDGQEYIWDESLLLWVSE